MNNSRLLFIDLARGVAVLFMLMVHVLEEMTTPRIKDSWFGFTIDFLGSPPAAPVFAFLMGTLLIVSRPKSIKLNIQRGLALLGLGYLLNFFRGYLPHALGLHFGLITEADLLPGTLSSTFWIVDIFQFAGLALIFLALLRRVTNKTLHWLLLTLVIVECSPLLWGHMSGIRVLDWFLSLLWGMEGKFVAFPIFPWISYPLCGMIFGTFLLQTANQSTFFTKSALLGVLLLSIGTLLIASDYQYHVGDYWHTGPGGILWIVGFILAWLCICNLVTKRLQHHPVLKSFYFWSNHVTAFYIIHWVIIGWASIFIEVDSMILALLLMLFITITSDLCTRLYLRGKHLYITG